MKRIAVLGATSGIAEASLREWLRSGDQIELLLVGRNSERLEAIAADLRVRGAASVALRASDLATQNGVLDAVEWIFSHGHIDTVLVAFGTMASQAEADTDPACVVEMLSVNGTYTVLAAHQVALRLKAQGSGALGVIGSVAGDRGRASNYLYGSAKAMVAAAVAGLQHSLRGSGVTVTLIKPGPTETAMTAHLRGTTKLAPVETVAASLVGAVDAGRPVVYAPSQWRLIMAVVRALPRPVFERTKL